MAYFNDRDDSSFFFVRDKGRQAEGTVLPARLRERVWRVQERRDGVFHVSVPTRLFDSTSGDFSVVWNGLLQTLAPE